VPSLIEIINELPLLPSGKLDRMSLPSPKALPTVSKSIKPPRTALEKKIVEVWEALFQPVSVSVDDDFFLDLAGHSLLAARMVSELRKDQRFASISIVDVYEHPTIESLAAIFDVIPLQTQQRSVNTKIISKKQDPINHKRHFIANIVQLASFYVIFGFRAVEWITPYLVFFLLLANHYSTLTAIVWAALSAVAVFPVLITVALAAKWIVLGRVRPGRYPLGGSYYLRWWF